MTPSTLKNQRVEGKFSPKRETDNKFTGNSLHGSKTPSTVTAKNQKMIRSTVNSSVK